MELKLYGLQKGYFVLVECGEHKAEAIYLKSITDEQLQAIYKIIGYNGNTQR